VKGIISTIVVASLLLLMACSTITTTTTTTTTASETGQETPASEFAKAAIRAQDKAAESSLRNAVAASKVFFTDGATYTGLNSSVAEIEPSLTWAGNEPATVGTISIDLADHGVFVLSTRSESGHLFCVGNDESSGDTFGTVDGYGATSAADCTGGPWLP